MAASNNEENENSIPIFTKSLYFCRFTLDTLTTWLPVLYFLSRLARFLATHFTHTHRPNQLPLTFDFGRFCNDHSSVFFFLQILYSVVISYQWHGARWIHDVIFNIIAYATDISILTCRCNVYSTFFAWIRSGNRVF